MPKGRKLSPESVAAVAAVVAALIALGVGVWENVQMRRHNRLSVVPHLNFNAELSDGEAPDSLPRGVIWLSNEGVGPAVLEEMSIVLREPSGEERRYASWSEALPAIRRLGLEVPIRAELGSGTMLGVGRRLELLRVTATERGGEEALRSLLDRLVLGVEYSSIYGDAFRASFDASGALETTAAGPL